jgi:hypothetical protein
MVPGGQEGHSSEAQSKSQENATGKNDDNHGVISLPLREIPGLWGWLILKTNLSLSSNPKNSLD